MHLQKVHLRLLETCRGQHRSWDSPKDILVGPQMSSLQLCRYPKYWQDSREKQKVSSTRRSPSCGSPMYVCRPAWIQQQSFVGARLSSNFVRKPKQRNRLNTTPQICSKGERGSRREQQKPMQQTGRSLTRMHPLYAEAGGVGGKCNFTYGMQDGTRALIECREALNGAT